MDRYKQLKIFLFLFLTFFSFDSFAYSSFSDAMTACQNAISANSFLNPECVDNSQVLGGNIYISLKYESSGIPLNSTCCSFPYPIPENCLPEEYRDPITQECILSPDCGSINYDPDGFYPDGFCPNLPANADSHPSINCQFPEGVAAVPECTLQECSDGSLLNQFSTCPSPKECSDGSVVYGANANCPPELFLCSNGETVLSLDQCPSATEDVKTCWDSTVVPVSFDCELQPIDNGTTVDPENPLKICPDGSQIDALTSCPVLVTGSSNINDTSTSLGSETTTTTTTNSDGSTSTSTSTTTINETTEINLDGLNNRLDNINKNTFDAAKAGREIADYMSAPFTDSFTSSPVTTEEIPFTFAPVSLASGGGCPAPQTYSMSFGSMSFNNQPICDFANGINGIVLSVCSMIGVYILIGGIRNA